MTRQEFKELYGEKLCENRIIKCDTKDFLKKYHAECKEFGMTWKQKNNQQTEFCSATCMRKYFEAERNKLKLLRNELYNEEATICKSKLKYNKPSNCPGCGKFCNTSHGFCDEECTFDTITQDA